MSAIRRLYRALVPLALRRRIAEARLHARVRRGELVNLHVHYPYYDVSEKQIAEDVRVALDAGFEYAHHIATLHNRPVDPFPDLSNLSILEIGPGLAVGPLLVCLAAGASSITTLDRFPVQWHATYHPTFYRRFHDEALRRWPARNWSASASICAAAAHAASPIQTLTGDVASSSLDIPDASFDATLSNATLEHVEDLAAAARNLARITKPGGGAAHLVDFRHHCDANQPLEFLTIPDHEYNRVLEQRQWREGNRVRVSELAAMFRAAGFEIDRIDTISRADAEYLARIRPRLLSRFAALDSDDLAILSARFRLRKPA